MRQGIFSPVYIDSKITKHHENFVRTIKLFKVNQESISVYPLQSLSRAGYSSGQSLINKCCHQLADTLFPQDL